MNNTYMRNVLNSLGYSNEHISENYSVQIDGTSAIKFDCVAFSDRYLKDVSTSCIAVQKVNDENEEMKYVNGAKYLATPSSNYLIKTERNSVSALERPICVENSEELEY